MFYENYRRIRDRENLTDYKVSKDTGIPQACLSDWKRDLYTPKTDKLVKLATYFGVSIEELIADGC